MISTDDPKFSELQQAREVLAMWAEFERERRAIGISMIGRLMESVREPEHVYKKISDGLILGEKVRLPRVEKTMIAERVRKIFQTRELWSGHYHEKEVLVSFFLHKSSNHLGCNQNFRAFRKQFRCSSNEGRAMIRASLLYFWKLWFHEEFKRY